MFKRWRGLGIAMTGRASSETWAGVSKGKPNHIHPPRSTMERLYKVVEALDEIRA
jgi:hypothetical protein